ncbi:MAG: hypothetical protein II670_03310 [Alphaproteobacteria bacterium]|nr:hypothetical protein [Alphaproteobacteria bacterium]
MKKEFCIAAARLIFDIVGADGYVSDRELNIMDGLLNDKYGLSNPERAFEVNRITFCDALQILQNWDNENEVKCLIEELKLISGVGRIVEKNRSYTTIEGHCSLSEAWLLLAIEYALNSNAIVFSIKKSEYRFARSEIIYLENNNENYKIYDEMQEHYGEYKSRLELFGMRLIYIPKVCSYLKEKREQRKLKSLMRYVSPFHKYEDQDAQKIVDNIDNITTKDFAKDLFSDKAKLYTNLTPSFLMKISTSVVAEDKPRKKSNFILIPIEETILNTLRKALNKYQEYTLDLHIPERKLHGRPFRLHGFDRTFLNFVMSHVLNTEKLTKVLFDFSYGNKKVQFVFDERRTMTFSLSNKQMCLYLLVLIFTTYKKGVPVNRATKRKTAFKTDVEKVFASIYTMVKENAEGDLYDGKGRIATDVSRIAQKLKDIPSAYHVAVVDNKAVVNFPCKDVVYIKFNKEEKLLDKEMKQFRDKDESMNFEDLCCRIFC